MPRAKLTYEQRQWLEKALKNKMNPLLICEHFGISSYQLSLEKKQGWVKEEKSYSAIKAQLSLK